MFRGWADLLPAGTDDITVNSIVEPLAHVLRQKASRQSSYPRPSRDKRARGPELVGGAILHSRRMTRLEQPARA